jgi:hypothetical protein
MAPSVLAYTFLWGQNNYNAHPFTPLGCKVEPYLYPSIRETWAPHSASGYYIGNLHKHYRCHEIYISDTRSNSICNTVFFKHKYLTMPSITPNVALILAADKLVNAIAGVTPKNSITKDAIRQLMAIYRQHALATSNAVSAQRVLHEIAQSQREQANKEPVSSQRMNEESWMDKIKEVDNVPNAAPTTSPPDYGNFEIDNLPTTARATLAAPVITQDEYYDSPLAANTCQR